MKYSPHEYQEYAKEFIVQHPEAAILLDCGMGKTVITLTAIQELLFDYFDISRVLVIAPFRVGRNSWPDELKKWEHLAGLTYSVAIGTAAERNQAVMNKAAQVVIINRENVGWLIENHSFDFDMVVIDELSSFKNHNTKRFKALMRIRSKIKRIVGLTGTPSSNGLMDLWAEYKLLDMGKRLGRFISRYRDMYFVPDKRSRDRVFSYKPIDCAEDEIYARINDITISMRSADYLNLPKIIVTNTVVRMDEKEALLYQKLKEQLVLEIGEKEIDAVSAAALSNKLMQLANGAIYDGNHETIAIHERKLDALEDLIEAANGKSVLVAYWFKHDLERIKQRFQVREIKECLDIADWNAGKIPVAVIHPASAGHGLNLQSGGSTIIWFGLTWSLELYQQTNARLYRQGQKETVVVQHIVSEGTIDEKILQVLVEKDTVQRNLIDAVKAEVMQNES